MAVLLSSLVLTVCTGLLERPLHYSGSVLGVRADVELFRRPKRASIVLRGLPVGGRLQGGASYNDAYEVTLDAPLERTLNLLRVNLRSVVPSTNWDRVFVVIRLPLFLGVHNVTLWQMT